MKTYLGVLLICVFSIAVLFGCDKDEKRKSSISIRMHDLPIDFDSVKVEVLEVLVHTDEEGWMSLNTQTGIYDLLLLQNGVDVVLVPPQEIPSGHLSQIRFVLGDENSVVIGGVNFPLSLSSQDESGLKLNLHEHLLADQNYVITVDFDAQQSVLETGNGTYKLKPVLTANVD